MVIAMLHAHIATSLLDIDVLWALNVALDVEMTKIAMSTAQCVFTLLLALLAFVAQDVEAHVKFAPIAAFPLVVVFASLRNVPKAVPAMRLAPPMINVETILQIFAPPAL